MPVFDLEEVRTSPDARVFSGRDAGLAARRYFRIDQLEKENSEFTIRVPDDALAVNVSFFLGLLGPSVRKNGEAEFRKRYHFCGRPVHQTTVEEGVRRALTDASVFD